MDVSIGKIRLCPHIGDCFYPKLQDIGTSSASSKSCSFDLHGICKRLSFDGSLDSRVGPRMSNVRGECTTVADMRIGDSHMAG